MKNHWSRKSLSITRPLIYGKKEKNHHRMVPLKWRKTGRLRHSVRPFCGKYDCHVGAYISPHVLYVVSSILSSSILFNSLFFLSLYGAVAFHILIFLYFHRFYIEKNSYMCIQVSILKSNGDTRFFNADGKKKREREFVFFFFIVTGYYVIVIVGIAFLKELNDERRGCECNFEKFLSFNVFLNENTFSIIFCFLIVLTIHNCYRYKKNFILKSSKKKKYFNCHTRTHN